MQELLFVTVTVYVVFEDGDTLPPETFPANPLLQLYVEIVPLPAVAFAARVVLWPLHIAVGLALGASVGIAFTLTETVPVAVQELLFVTVTVYVVFAEGETLPPDTLPASPLLQL